MLLSPSSFFTISSPLSPSCPFSFEESFHFQQGIPWFVTFTPLSLSHRFKDFLQNFLPFASFRERIFTKDQRYRERKRYRERERWRENCCKGKISVGLCTIRVTFFLHPFHSRIQFLSWAKDAKMSIFPSLLSFWPLVFHLYIEFLEGMISFLFIIIDAEL